MAPSEGSHCTENQGFVRWMMPSLVPSLAFTKKGIQSFGRVSASTAYLRKVPNVEVGTLRIPPKKKRFSFFRIIKLQEIGNFSANCSRF